MAAEAEASREARAKVIAAEGEMKSSRALKEASDVMCESPAALQVKIACRKFIGNESHIFFIVYFQLRYLQTLNSIASEKNSTIIFPLPIDLFKGFMQRWSDQGGFYVTRSALHTLCLFMIKSLNKQCV